MDVVRRSTNAQIFNAVLFVFTVIALAVLFWSGLMNVFQRWELQPEYSHGYLVPVIAAYLIWERKNELAVHWGRGSTVGIAVCLLALLIFAVGEVSALYLLIHYAFLIFLLGWSLIIVGRGTRLSIVPIVMLVFAIPLPYFIEVILTAKLQLVSSDMGVRLIRLFDIPVYLSGNVIDLGEFKLHVVEACSGLRYLFPLACLGFLAAYFYQAEFWKRALIFISTIPITIVMNSVRIGVTGILVEHWGADSATGFLHDFEGWVIFVLCLIIMLLELKLLEFFTSKRSLTEAFRRPEVKSMDVKREKNLTRLAVSQSVLLTIIAVGILSLEMIDAREENAKSSTSLASFPMALGQWQGSRDVLAHDIVQGLQFSDYLLADFRSGQVSSEQLNFYVAYYDSQRKGVSPHSPKVCIPGGGWEIAEFTRTKLNNMPVNRVLIRKGNTSQLVYYWFVERGQVVANEYVKKWLLFRDALLLNRSDGALVRVVTPVNPQEGIKTAEARAASFIQVAQDKLEHYLPAIDS